MSELRRVGLASELWDGDVIAACVDGVKLVVVKIDGAVHAYADRCAHLGVELSRGTLAGCVLTCSAHHWEYDATTGEGINPAHARLTRYETRIEDGVIYVKL
jgi:toluene monooxygenase system ferredoxin subunit